MTEPGLAAVPPAASALIDARPLLARNKDSIWERIEQIRARLYTLVERRCADCGIEALALQSNPYAYPAWVRFECWLPDTDPSITARAAMTVTISAVPYHRYEALYKVEWERHGQSGVFDQVYAFDAPQLAQMIEFLRSAPANSFASYRVKSILKPVQLRQAWWQIWKPTNRVVTIHRDWLQIASFALLATGALLIAGESVQSGRTGGVSVSPTATTPVESPPIETPDEPARQPAAPPPAAGTGEVIPGGEPVSGTLTQDSPVDAGRYYRIHSFSATAGQTVVITLKSPDFDTLLVLAKPGPQGYVPFEKNDDGGNDGTNSQLEFLVPESGAYGVMATTLEPGKTGEYTLQVRPVQ